MVKKGQLTLFIIIGILIVAAVGIGFYLSSISTVDELDDEVLETAIETIPVQSFVDTCLEKTLIDGVLHIGLQGGYYIIPNDFIFNLGFMVPIFHDNVNGDFMPSIGNIEEEISYYVIDNIDICLNGFEVFTKMGTTITEGGREYDVTILDDEVRIKLKDKILAQSEGKVHQFNEFNAKAPAALGLLWDYARLYIDAQKELPNEEPLGYLMRLAYENDFTFETMNRDDVYIYAFNKNMSQGSYVYAFAVRYNWSDIA